MTVSAGWPARTGRPGAFHRADARQREGAAALRIRAGMADGSSQYTAGTAKGDSKHMKMYLISDNVDTYTGMRLAGVDGVVVHECEDLREALEYVLSD